MTKMASKIICASVEIPYYSTKVQDPACVHARVPTSLSSPHVMPCEPRRLQKFWYRVGTKRNGWGGKDLARMQLTGAIAD